MLNACRAFILVQLLAFSTHSRAADEAPRCSRLLSGASVRRGLEKAQHTVANGILKLMASRMKLPEWQKSIEESRLSGEYRAYANFGAMAMAKIGFMVRYDEGQLQELAEPESFVLMANHPSGMVDGMALQYLVGKARPGKPSGLFLATWIQKILPHAVMNEEDPWGTAIPLEINEPSRQDPNYEENMARKRESTDEATAMGVQVLKDNGVLISFPRGSVATIPPGGRYPADVEDAPRSWRRGSLTIARRTRTKIVLAHVNAVNSWWFYRLRRFFPKSDRSRIIWFFIEALKKRGKVIEVHFSEPMTITQMYERLAVDNETTAAALKADPDRTNELLRQYVYRLPHLRPFDRAKTDVSPD